MKLGVLCSGGKDSWYACYRAMEKEEVACLISIRSGNEESYMFHTPNTHLVPLQAEAAGLPLVTVETAGEKEAELADLACAIRTAVEQYGIEGVVTGALLSVYQATRVQRICRDLGLWCFNPLWYTDPDTYMESLLAAGFRVVITGVFAAPFSADWLGREIDADALSDLQKYVRSHRITLTGEGGEYETLVLDAPVFSRRIAIKKAEKEYASYRGFFRVTQAVLEAK
ncbi:diphthine--ammonia ligase [Methanoregula sp.]|uniref:diphthine--ammonia ligase n=1 Tax=Methanoregula sp. TaxID=2052170 RepID=UPI002C29AB85|nr:diphthine--ammonia ligase [Methanoregula sp.]HVP97602.1 diphthine--ammonia ligase [Methanoregula sp.]